MKNTHIDPQTQLYVHTHAHTLALFVCVFFIVWASKSLEMHKTPSIIISEISTRNL